MPVVGVESVGISIDICQAEIKEEKIIDYALLPYY